VESHRFDAVARILGCAASRRSLGRALIGGGLGALVGSALGTPIVDAAKKHKKKSKQKKNKKPRPQTDPLPRTDPQPQPQPRPDLVLNQYGCVNVGGACRGDNALCCSGICEGEAPGGDDQPDASRCVGHNAGICKASTSVCSTGVAPACNPNNSRSTCLATTGNAGFCGDFSGDGGTGATYFCRNCSRDTDCQEEFGAGAACVVYDGICSDICPATRNTACMPAGI